MEFSRQEYWSGLPFPSPTVILYPGLKKKKKENTATKYAWSGTKVPVLSDWQGWNHWIPHSGLINRALFFPCFIDGEMDNGDEPCQQHPTLLASGTGFMEDNFSTDGGMGGGCFQDDSRAFHLLCTLFLLLYHFNLKSSCIRSWRLGALALSLHCRPPPKGTGLSSYGASLYS